MTDLEQYQQKQQSSMASWAADAHQIAGVAQSLVRTSFVPQSYNGKPAEATAAILTGAELGLSPMASLRSIVVIQGTPALTAQAIRGLVQAHGHEVWVEESSSQRAIVKGRRKGSDNVHTSTWDMPRAAQLGLTNKQNWKQQPTAMLIARATSEVCRLIAADVLMGLPYSQEELTDEVTPTDVQEKKPRTTKIQRQPLPSEDEPALPEETTPPAESAPEATYTLEEPPVEEWPTVTPGGKPISNQPNATVTP